MVAKIPSILESGDGLGNTHVSLDDVNAVIRVQMETENQLTSDSIMDVIGDGNGFCSVVILITCKWVTPSESLPNQIILKVASMVHITGMIKKAVDSGQFPISVEEMNKTFKNLEKMSKTSHNQEIHFYGLLESQDTSRLLAPKIYFSQKFDDEHSNNGFIGMEYIEGSYVRHAYKNCSVEEIQPVLKAIASIQALTFLVPEEDLEKIGDGINHEEGVKGMLAGEGLNGICIHAKNRNPGRFTEKMERIQKYCHKILESENAFNLNEALGIKNKVFVHGDLWSPNILWTNGENGKHCASKIIDFQGVHTGNPAIDLVRVLGSTLSGENRQKHWETILEKFHSFFVAELTKYEKEVPYTLNQLKQSYCLHFPIGGIGLLALFGPGVDINIQSMDQTEANESRRVLEEKLDCLLDDIEKYYLESAL